MVSSRKYAFFLIECSLNEDFFLDSVDSKQKKNPIYKILPQVGLDLRTSDFPVLHSTTELTQKVQGNPN